MGVLFTDELEEARAKMASCENKLDECNLNDAVRELADKARPARFAKHGTAFAVEWARELDLAYFNEWKMSRLICASG